MKIDKKSINVDDAVDMAINFVRGYPCAICSYEDSNHKCIAGIKYKGTCPVYMRLKCELLKLRTTEEK